MAFRDRAINHAVRWRFAPSVLWARCKAPSALSRPKDARFAPFAFSTRSALINDNAITRKKWHRNHNFDIIRL